MTDTTQGADAPDDAALFQRSNRQHHDSKSSRTRNLKTEAPDKPADKSADKPADKPGDKPH
jgi:hypothetical protein